jgi:putative ABC transport system permease protein
LTTVLGITVVITILLSVLGILDSVAATSAAARLEIVGANPTRTIVTLDRLYPANARALRAIAASPAVGGVEASLRVAGTLQANGHSIPTIVELLNASSTQWHPSAIAGTALRSGGAGVLISDKAARDLGTSPGHTVTLRYPRPTAASSFTLARAPIRVAGIDGNPIRTFAFLDASQSRALGYDGAVNTLSVVAAPHVTQIALERVLIESRAAASVEPASAVPDVSRDRLNDFLRIFDVVEAISLGLALLIAFNAATISADERARDHATMFAFGLPVRAVVASASAESFLIGLLGTALAIVPGYALLGWIVRDYLERTYADFGMLVAVSPKSALVIAVVGVVAVALAPLLTIRALRRLDVPARLRTVE